MYGKLEVFTGPMFSGKTAELLTKYDMIEDKKTKIIIKPAFDKRFSENKVVSRVGLSAEALSISEWQSLDDNIKHVFFDEINFLVSPMFDGDLVHIIRELLKNGINVYACGLDTDWKGYPFLITGQLCAMADQVHKLKAFCNVCKKDASKTFKIQPNDSIYETGDKDLYEARCNEHWHCHNQ